MGCVSFTECGIFSLTLTAEEINDEAPDGLCIAEIRLEPVASN